MTQCRLEKTGARPSTFTKTAAKIPWRRLCARTPIPLGDQQRMLGAGPSRDARLAALPRHSRDQFPTDPVRCWGRDRQA